MEKDNQGSDWLRYEGDPMTDEQKKMLTERFKGRKTPVNHPDSDLIAENDMVELLTEPAIPGLEKIEPMNTIYPTIMEATLKLNEVIEKVNLMMAYLNQGVRKWTQLTT